MIITFQEFEKHEQDRAKWLGQAIAQYMRSDEYKFAQEADLYEKQLNTKINSGGVPHEGHIILTLAPLD